MQEQLYMSESMFGLLADSRLFPINFWCHWSWSFMNKFICYYFGSFFVLCVLYAWIFNCLCVMQLVIELIIV
jgi:hypothetical protein